MTFPKPFMKVTAQDNNATVDTMCRHLSIKLLCMLTSLAAEKQAASNHIVCLGSHAQWCSKCWGSYTRILVQLKIKYGHPFWSVFNPASLHSLALVLERKMLPRVEEREEKHKKRWVGWSPASPGLASGLVSFTTKPPPPVWERWTIRGEVV